MRVCSCFLLILLTACGARTGLELPWYMPDADMDDERADADRVIPPDGDVTPDADPDGVIPSCSLELQGEPIEIHSDRNRDMLTPSSVLLEPGSGVREPSFAIQTVTSSRSSGGDGVEALQIVAGDPWPSGAHFENAPLLIGPESLTYAQMSHHPDTPDLLYLSWFGDLGVRLGVIDWSRWAVEFVETITDDGSTPLGLSPGQALGPEGYEGSGFGMVWIDREFRVPESPHFSIVNMNGELQETLSTLEEPFPPSQSPNPAVVWNGVTYVIATAFNECVARDDFCEPLSLVLSRARFTSDGSSIEVVDVIPSYDPFYYPTAPRMVHHRGRTYLAWSEASAGNPERVNIRYTELDSNGVSVDDRPEILISDAFPVRTVQFTATDLGLILSWAERSGSSTAEDQPGHSEMIIYRYDLSFDEVEQLTIPGITAFSSSGNPAAVTTELPQSLYLTWSGRQVSGDVEVIYLARFDCI